MNPTLQHPSASQFPSDMIDAALQLVMPDNMLQFGDAFWRQPRGTAVGASTAVNHVNLCVGLLAVAQLLPRFRKQLMFHRRFIDDGIGAWLCEDPLIWAAFLERLSQTHGAC